MRDKKRIVILGSTGSVGESAVKVASFLSEEVEVVGVAARGSCLRLAGQAAELGCKYAAVGDASFKGELERLLPPRCKAFAGPEGLAELACLPEVDMVLCSIVGTAGLVPVIRALEAGKDVALASKEILVMAGELIMPLAAKSKGKLIPVDSEHSAIFQCLEGRDMMDVSKLILTASGGPFRGATPERLKSVTWQEACSHPTWNMGPKISIDSATLMNKALEVVEAHFLFGMPGDAIEVLIHPQSIIHSMVEFVDGSALAQLSAPDMRFPIQYALTHPRKQPGGLPPLDFAKLGTFSFETPDRALFPSLDFAYEAISAGGTMPAVLNAANEVAVERFRRAEISFTGIWTVIERAMSLHSPLERPSLDAILNADFHARATASSVKP